MAKWGEGDPRWIVEERPDGKNVNNWHWTEKNATNWSIQKLKELLVGHVIEDSEVFCELKSVTSVEGEATANNRKAKLIFFYEWVIKGEWSGKLKAGDKKYKGKFEIPNLSEEHEPDEVDVNVSVDKATDESYTVKEFMRKVGASSIQMQLAQYIKQLKEEYSHNVILPTKEKAPKQKTTNEEMLNAKAEMNKMTITSEKASSSGPATGVKIQTRTLKTTEEFRCSPADLYRAFTDKEMVQAFTGASALYEVEKGGRISLMNGYVTGGFVEIVPDKKLVQRWRVKTWPDAHFSTVTLTFEDRNGATLLNLTQTEIPASEYEKTVEGWRVNYWERIKQVFGFGARIF